jgi:hypothetical protein
MAALGAATVTGDNRFGGARSAPDGKRRRNAVRVVFGDGVSTYPTNGVPMPAAGQFGLVRFLESLQLNDASSPDGFVYKYDTVHNSIRIYGGSASAGTAGTEMSAAGVPANGTTLYATAVGW